MDLKSVTRRLIAGDNADDRREARKPMTATILNYAKGGERFAEGTVIRSLTGDLFRMTKGGVLRRVAVVAQRPDGQTLVSHITKLSKAEKKQAKRRRRVTV